MTEGTQNMLLCQQVLPFPPYLPSTSAAQSAHNSHKCTPAWDVPSSTRGARPAALRRAQPSLTSRPSQQHCPTSGNSSAEYCPPASPPPARQPPGIAPFSAPRDSRGPASQAAPWPRRGGEYWPRCAAVRVVKAPAVSSPRSAGRVEPRRVELGWVIPAAERRRRRGRRRRPSPQARAAQGRAH
jgi:hypothetical protein